MERMISGKFSIIWLFRQFHHQTKGGEQSEIFFLLLFNISIFSCIEIHINFFRKPSTVKKEKRSVRRIDGGIKAIANDEETRRNSDDEEATDNVRLLERQKRRERLQEERKKRVAIVRCLFVVRWKSTHSYVYVGRE